MSRIRAWLSAANVSVGTVASLGTAGWAQMNARDLDHALAHYADDAQIDSKAAGGKVSKSAYREQVTRAWARNRDARTDLTEKHEWKMEKRDGSWLIVETSYQ